MSAIGRLAVLAALLFGTGACALFAPPPPQLHGGAVTHGEAVDRLARAAGVEGVGVPPAFNGNLVWLDATHALTSRHVVRHDADEVTFHRSGGVGSLRILDRGDERREKTWTLLRHDGAHAGPPSTLPLGGPVEPGQEVAIVGWSSWQGPDETASMIVMQGFLLPTPLGLEDDLPDLLCVDVGPRLLRLAGLSGSPLLTRTEPGAPWRWVGIMEAIIVSTRDDRIAVALPLPVELVRSVRAGDAVGAEEAGAR